MDRHTRTAPWVHITGSEPCRGDRKHLLRQYEHGRRGCMLRTGRSEDCAVTANLRAKPPTRHTSCIGSQDRAPHRAAPAPVPPPRGRRCSHPCDQPAYLGCEGVRAQPLGSLQEQGVSLASPLYRHRRRRPKRCRGPCRRTYLEPLCEGGRLASNDRAGCARSPREWRRWPPSWRAIRLQRMRKRTWGVTECLARWKSSAAAGQQQKVARSSVASQR